MFIVLVIQFRAFPPALIIMSAAPLSLLGVFGMLWVTGTALNVSSFMGIILMVGLVVKNGIILFEYVHKLWEEQGMPLREALVQAGKIRVRPILMTTLCTLFGLTAPGAGPGLRRGIAKASGAGRDRRPLDFHLHHPAGDAGALFLARAEERAGGWGLVLLR